MLFSQALDYLGNKLFLHSIFIQNKFLYVCFSDILWTRQINSRTLGDIWKYKRRNTKVRQYENQF